MRFALFFTILFCTGFAGCSGDGQKPQGRSAAPIVSTTVRTADMPRTLQAVGNVVASSTVSIKSRIAGELMAVHFTEGDEVRAGQKLFSIDPRQNDTAVQEAASRLLRDKAQLLKAEDDLKRYETLVGGGFISREQYDQARTSALSLRATVKEDEALLESARLQRSYCDIYAPVAGRTGAVLVNKGNMVRATDDQALVVIDSLEPVFVRFSVPETALAGIMEQLKQGGVPVQATPTGGSTTLGSLTFVDSSVDAATGTIRLKASFPNKDRTLWPGQFVQAVALLGEDKDALVVPAAAVQTGRDSAYVYVVTADNTAEFRPVTAAPEVNGQIRITHGVRVGERIVLDGHVRLRPGAAVQEYVPESGTVDGGATSGAPQGQTVSVKVKP